MSRSRSFVSFSLVQLPVDDNVAIGGGNHGSAPSAVAARHRGYLLGLLLTVLAANYMDGLALGLMLQDIKTDLHLTDSQLGLLTGFAFALFYSLLGIPIARWADRGDRVTIIAVTAALWSVMVCLCGMAASFAQLVLARVGVGVGEAGCIPPAHSLIADSFARSERPRAVSIFLLGNSVSMIFGYLGAGWVNQVYGWRFTFLLLGLLGLIPAVLTRVGLRDPRKQDRKVKHELNKRETPNKEQIPSIRNVRQTLWRNRTFRNLLYAFSIVYFFSNGIAQWQPAFFIRSYGLKTAELGAWFAIIYGVGGFVGTYIGGVAASRYAANNERAQLRAMAIAYLVYGVLASLVYLSTSVHTAFCLMAGGVVVGATTAGPLFATMQALVPERMRAMSIAIVYLFANLIGLGLGPLATGVLSDLLHRYFGEQSLRYALLSLCPGFAWVAWHLWRASQTAQYDIQAVLAESSGPVIQRV
jgi:predicted MFS family arabinose efflux permease